ncbi:hypothetical protein [Nostoc sp.]|uniref:hypothetical protein n=1 Tax=Nostoc sp. TaxID=1180 RepID=UPI002FF926EA
MAKVLGGVDADKLAQMLPPAAVGMKLEPIRLCAACYIRIINSNKIVGWVEALRNPTPGLMLGCAPLHPTYV